MKIGILGTGVVGRTLAAALASKGHDVTIGTRDPARTLAPESPGTTRGTPFPEWQRANQAVRRGMFADAARGADAVINATSGSASLAALEGAGAGALADVILLDVGNPLDFSHGMPPTLTVCNTDSLGEHIQRAFPRARVVKTLNTTTAAVMVNLTAARGSEMILPIWLRLMGALHTPMFNFKIAR
jgi:predicted dinucleotide-binding enzyme